MDNESNKLTMSKRFEEWFKTQLKIAQNENYTL